MAWYWWLLVGILIGWLLSTLIEWLWFRRKRMEVRDERVAQLEKVLRASGDDSTSSTLTGSTVGVTATLADRNVTLEAPDLDAAVGMPDLDIPDVDLPDVDLSDVPDELGGLAASIDAAEDMPHIEMPNVDLPDVSAKLDVAKTGSE